MQQPVRTRGIKKVSAMLSLPLRRIRAPRALLVLTALLLMGDLAHAQAPLRPSKSANYRPFTIVSSKLQKEMPATFIEERLMCRSTLTTMPEIMDLVQNYDLLRTSPTDGSMSMTAFRGRQDGRPVEVLLGVQSSNRTLLYLWVAGELLLSCV